jgi:stage II sporulation protein AA (anti-sigma F factor antagonist)
LRRITITGEIDLANAAVVQREVFAAITNQLTGVVLDLSDVTYIDSSGMQLLFSLADKLRTLQVELAVEAPTGSPARRVIELSGMSQLISLAP